MNWFEIDQQDFHQPTENLDETGFWENANAAWAETTREQLPIVSPAQNNTTMEFRRTTLSKHIESGAIPPEVVEFYQNRMGGFTQDYDIEGLSNYAKYDLGLDDVMTEEEYIEARNQEYNDYRAKESEIYAAQNKAGLLGEFTGRVVAHVQDPVYLLGMATGYAAAGTALEATVLRTALTTAGTEMFVETAATPAKMSFQKELGLDYRASDAIVNILAAGAFGGAIGAGGKAVETKLFNALNPKQMTVREAIERIEHLQSPETADDIAPIMHVLRSSDPDTPVLEVLKSDESVTAAWNNRTGKRDADPRASEEASYFKEAEEEYAAVRGAGEGVTEEGVTIDTPSKTTDEPMNELVLAKYNEIADLDDKISRLEEVC